MWSVEEAAALLSFGLRQVPASCCLVDSSGEATPCDSDNPVVISKIYTDDCFVSGLAFVTSHAQLMGNIAFAMACLLVTPRLLKWYFSMSNKAEYAFYCRHSELYWRSRTSSSSSTTDSRNLTRL